VTHEQGVVRQQAIEHGNVGVETLEGFLVVPGSEDPPARADVPCSLDECVIEGI
jgi:hypothetical protein